MGTGVSKALHSHKTNAARIIDVPDGHTISLKNAPLVYGEKDPTISSRDRKIVEAYEKELWREQNEHVALYDANGEPTIPGGEMIGSHDHVLPPESAWRNAKIATHNHPRGADEAGYLGGTFSHKDLINGLCKRESVTLRAVAPEGTYSISKSSGFKSRQAQRFFKKSFVAREKIYLDTVNRIQKDFDAGKVSAKKGKRQLIGAFNEFMVGFHNDLLANQTKYGYYYTLERR